jgi:PAS domain-containing protein
MIAGLFNDSRRPIYAINAERRIVYCNRALATWLDIEASRIIGRVVEYHSEPTADEDEPAMMPLTDSCASAAGVCWRGLRGTLSCMAREGDWCIGG